MHGAGIRGRRRLDLKTDDWVGIDWGTTHRRAWRFAGDALAGRAEDAQGLLVKVGDDLREAPTAFDHRLRGLGHRPRSETGNVCTGVRTRDGDRATKAGPRAGDEHHLAGQVEERVSHRLPDLAPGRDVERLQRDVAKPRNGRSLGEHLRRQAGIDGAKAALVFEVLDKAALQDLARVAATIKRLPLRLLRPRPIAETISTAGGVRLQALDDALMLRALPGTFVAGEMLDWEAPTGGYLLTACFASGKRAGEGAVRWLQARP